MLSPTEIANKINLNRLTEFRKYLHRHPELSGEETSTQKAIQSYLKTNLHLDSIAIGNTGVLAKITGASSGPQILIRGDIDALPIGEVNTFAHRSKYEGVSHKCGHDGHTTIICGLAEILLAQTITKGTVYLLFQPAEENGTGAELVMQELIKNNYSIDFCFALHNIPGYEKNKIIIKNQSFTAAVQSLVLKLKGKTAHAAEPENGNNPALAIAEIIKCFDENQITNLSDPNFFISAPIYARMGMPETYGISAGYGEIRYTFRSWKNEVLHRECQINIDKALAIASRYNLATEHYWTAVFNANENHPLAMKHLRNTLNQMDLSTEERTTPFKWGEDFGLFTQNFKGAMFGLGAGTNCPALHNPDYDFPDEITATGVAVFYNTIQNILA